jgi:predicted naringenin-chalcone synthase
MCERSGIEHRYSFLKPSIANDAVELDKSVFYKRNKNFPGTAERMRVFKRHAPVLAAKAIGGLKLGSDRRDITHLLITCCTGFYAPGLDLELIDRCGLPASVERSIIGFMGCYAAINALKLARHIVRSEPAARVLVVNLELCTLHFKDPSNDLAQLIMSMLWGDGCAASLVTSEPEGLAIDSFRSMVIPDTSDMMQWHIGDQGFDMVLSGDVPASIHRALRDHGSEFLEGAPTGKIDLWAIHPGGRTILDAVEESFGLAPEALAISRQILKRYGNMSAATVMFVLQSMMHGVDRGARGCAMAFGPGLTAETMLFRTGALAPAGGTRRTTGEVARLGQDHEFAA